MAPATPPASPAEESAKAKKIDEYVTATYQDDTETRSREVARQQRVLAEHVERVLGSWVDVGGYFRAGYGLSDRGTPLVAFGAPGADAKYRLGNEAENYGELIIGKSVYLPGTSPLNERLGPDGKPVGPIARVQLRISALSPYATLGQSAATTFGLPEAWASIANAVPALPGAKFWAGRRYYRRHDIHMNDFFFWQMTGGGGGIEDVQVGPAKLALAWIGFGSTSGLSSVPAPDPVNAAGFAKSTVDLRAYDIPLLSGTLEVGAALATIRTGVDQSGQDLPATTGGALNVIHTATGFLCADGTNKLSLQFGTGPAKTFNSGFETVQLAQGAFIRADERGSWRARITDHFIANLHEHFSLGAAAVFQATDHDDGTGRQYWYSAGVRPTVHFTRHLNVALEAGLDGVRDTGADTSGVLGKVTLAPQVSAGNRFESRPAIRAFVTAAAWSDDFRGRIGGGDYATRSYGLNGGMQMEAWW